MFNAFDRRDRFDLVTVVAAFYHLQDFCEALERLRGLVATGDTLATLGVAHSSTPVSYTHLTLPTNREV